MTAKLNPEVKQRWLAALRSGDYKQTEGVLCRLDPDTEKPVGYCCLGVLTDLLADELRLNVRDVHDGVTMCREWEYSSALAPGEVGYHAYGRGERGVYWIVTDPETEAKVSLVALNDGDPSYGIRRRTFAEIADLIEDQL